MSNSSFFVPAISVALSGTFCISKSFLNTTALHRDCLTRVAKLLVDLAVFQNRKTKAINCDDAVVTTASKYAFLRFFEDYKTAL